MAEDKDEQVKDESNGKALYRRLFADIELYDKTYEGYLDRCDTIMKRYRDDRGSSSGKKAPRFNSLWSTNNITEPSIYSQRPKPIVKRRFNDKDDIGRVASEILERDIAYTIDSDCFDETMKSLRKDFSLLARAVPWVRYVATGASGKQLQVNGEEDFDDNDDLAYEEVYVDYVHRKDFGHTVARKWSDVTAVWRKVYLTRKQLKERFGEKGAKVKLDYVPEEVKAHYGSDQDQEFEHMKKAVVYEVWDKSEKQTVWLCRSSAKAEPLDVQPDVLGLKSFFPCPRPAYGTLDNDSLIPLPDYSMTQDVSQVLDMLLGRITAISESIKNVGAFAGENEELLKILQSPDNTMVSVKEFHGVLQQGGWDALIWLFPVERLIPALETSKNLFSFFQAIDYEVSGNSDILRGASDPNETYGAQRIKSTFASRRLKEKQDEFSRMVRDVLAMIGEVIAEKFEPTTIGLMAGVDQMGPDEQQSAGMALQVFRDEKSRNFRIDIETDSTIAIDEGAEKEEVAELTKVLGDFFQRAIPLAKDVPALGPVIVEYLMFVIRRFKAGRSLEDTLEQALGQALAQAQGGQQAPDPKMMAEQAKIQMEEQKMQLEMQKASAELAMKQKEIEAKYAMQAQEFAVKREQISAELKMSYDKMIAEMDLHRKKASDDFMLQAAKQNGSAVGAIKPSRKVVRLMDDPENPGQRIGVVEETPALTEAQ